MSAAKEGELTWVFRNADKISGDETVLTHLSLIPSPPAGRGGRETEERWERVLEESGRVIEATQSLPVSRI
jgi:hypothetical protein